MQFDFKEKAKKRQDRNSPIKPLFCIQFENPSKVSWGEFQISMGFVQPPRSAPIFDSPHESLVTPKMQGSSNFPAFLRCMTHAPFVQACDKAARCGTKDGIENERGAGMQAPLLDIMGI